MSKAKSKIGSAFWVIVLAALLIGTGYTYQELNGDRSPVYQGQTNYGSCFRYNYDYKNHDLDYAGFFKALPNFDSWRIMWSIDEIKNGYARLGEAFFDSVMTFTPKDTKIILALTFYDRRNMMQVSGKAVYPVADTIQFKNDIEWIIGEFADRGVKIFAVHNEPDIPEFVPSATSWMGTPEQYQAQAEIFARTIKSINPYAYIIYAQFSSLNQQDTTFTFLKRACSKIDTSLFDCIDWHYYGDWEPVEFEKRIKRIAKYSENRGLDWSMLECGYRPVSHPFYLTQKEKTQIYNYLKAGKNLSFINNLIDSFVVADGADSLYLTVNRAKLQEKCAGLLRDYCDIATKYHCKYFHWFSAFIIPREKIWFKDSPPRNEKQIEMAERQIEKWRGGWIDNLYDVEKGQLSPTGIAFKQIMGERQPNKMALR